MDFWFFICIFGVISVIPIHFLSDEQLKLQTKYGKKKGNEIGKIYGLISGWGFFLFWIGIWISPQPSFVLPLFQNLSILTPIRGFSIPLLYLIISLFFIIFGAWFGIMGVKNTSLKVAEIHRTKKIVKKGVYRVVRHPQYFGGLLAHVGVSFLFSGLYSFFVTPLMIVLVYLIAKKEEMELIREFGKEYEDYLKVPMLIPRIFHYDS
ncbi:isoprenylcysteine carboxylmethyltransferase family protein [Candidatus Bathyarchaeota archaeon]|nr:isoprenylcysteine carboxylmethyltransferase family protein [Candidatus Bathyarchaeota archaeon]